MGVFALLVVTILSFASLFTISQTQPEPKCVTALVINSFLNASKEPKAFVIEASSVVDNFVSFSESDFQKKS